MNVWEYVLGIALIVASVALIVIVLFQKDRASTGQNAFDAGSSDSYYGKNKGRSKDAVMGRLTRILAIVMLVIAICINLFILAPKYRADLAASAASAASASAASASAALTSSDASVASTDASSAETSIASSVDTSVESSVESSIEASMESSAANTSSAGN